MNRRRNFACLALAFTFALPGVGDTPSQAYVINGPWLGPSTTLRLHDSSFPFASPELVAVLSARDQWNLNPSNFRFAVVLYDSVVGRNNGENEVWMTPNLGHPAVTYPIYDAGGNLVEADIVFNDDKCWAFNPTSYTSLEGYGASCRLMEASAIHEMGHALGLAHEGDEYNVMGHAWQHVHVNGSTADAYVGEDASDGAVALYGLSPFAGEDVSVSHWKYDAAATGTDEYSHHQRVEVFTATGGPVGGTPENGGTRYRVSAGQTLQVEFTYENNGATSQSPWIRFVLSNDNWITTSDTLLASHHPTLNRNDVFTFTHTITLPSTVTAGNQYIGVIVDPDNLIAEVNETNNATWIPIEVR